jgi:hypothetical protein
MGGRRIALLGSLLVALGALAGCAADSSDSDDSSDEDVAASQAGLEAPAPVNPGGGNGSQGAPRTPSTMAPAPQAAPDVTGDKVSDPEPSPWQPPTGGNDSMQGDDGQESPALGGRIHIH